MYVTIGLIHLALSALRSVTQDHKNVLPKRVDTACHASELHHALCAMAQFLEVLPETERLQPLRPPQTMRLSWFSINKLRR